MEISDGNSVFGVTIKVYNGNLQNPSDRNNINIKGGQVWGMSDYMNLTSLSGSLVNMQLTDISHRAQNPMSNGLLALPKTRPHYWYSNNAQLLRGEF